MATEGQIKSAYRKAALIHHPDKQARVEGKRGSAGWLVLGTQAPHPWEGANTAQRPSKPQCRASACGQTQGSATQAPW